MALLVYLGVYKGIYIKFSSLIKLKVIDLINIL